MPTEGYFDRLANIRGRVAVIVGGGDGVGRAVTLALAEAGVDLAVCDIDGPSLTATCSLARDMGVRCIPVQVDVTLSAELAEFYDGVSSEFPNGIDILVNIVGGGKRAMFAETNAADWQRDIDMNFGQAIASVRRAIDLMRRHDRGGSIINFSSIEAHRGAGSFAVYAGAKAALTNFSRALAVELGPERIRVNCVAPDTSPSKTSQGALSPELMAANARIAPGQWDRMWPLYIPQGYCPPLDDLAKAVLYLASDLSTSVTGNTLHVDGGTFAASGFLNWPEGVGLLPTALGGALEKLFPATDEDRAATVNDGNFLAGSIVPRQST